MQIPAHLLQGGNSKHIPPAQT